MNINLFKSVIFRNGCNLREAAKKLNITPTTLGRKLTEIEGVFTRKDIVRFVDCFDTTKEEVFKIFFDEISREVK